MKNKTTIAGLLFMTLITSCGEKELTKEEKIRKTVEIYLNDMKSTEPEIVSYTIDSLEIRNITPKKALEIEAIETNRELEEVMAEAEELEEEYRDSKNLSDMYSELNGGQMDAFSKTSSDDQTKMEQEYVDYKKKADELMELLEDKMKKSKTANNKYTKYYGVIVHGTFTSKSKVQKDYLLPFYISKKYTILKEPKEIL